MVLIIFYLILSIKSIIISIIILFESFISVVKRLLSTNIGGNITESNLLNIFNLFSK